MKKRTVTKDAKTAPMEYWRRAMEKAKKEGKKRTAVTLSAEALEALGIIIERENYFSMNEAINQVLIKEAKR